MGNAMDKAQKPRFQDILLVAHLLSYDRSSAHATAMGQSGKFY